MWLNLNYDLLKNWKAILFTSIGVVIFYLSIIYLHPENMEWVGSENFSWTHTLWFVLVDQLAIETISVIIIFQLIRIYAIKFALNQLHLSIGELVKYELKFLPIVLLAYFVFAPVSMSIRYLLHYGSDLNSEVYLNEYFYSFTTYLNYLTPVFLISYSIININLLRLYNQQLGQTSQDLTQAKKPKLKDRLWATDDFGEVFLEVDKILWIEREDRKTFASTTSDKYRLKENLTELEEKLDPDSFVRVNRGSIVNLQEVLNYSFWENDKYILRLKESDKEFIVSRDRMSKIKNRFLVQQD
ncbi:MAG: LytTR family transcriptional regulator [bacterium]|nr:LytTR family transcriptional regulator [bacterium]